MHTTSNEGSLKVALIKPTLLPNAQSSVPAVRNMKEIRLSNTLSERIRQNKHKDNNSMNKERKNSERNMRVLKKPRNKL